MKENKGITLVALVVTIIVLIILAGVSINLILGQYGIVNRATSGTETYSEKQAKEKLELELSNMYIEKSTNINYNENDYLTTKLSEKGFSVNGNIVIVDGYQFQIDRTVPKIMNSLGKGIENNEIILTANSNLEVDYTKSTIKIEITYAGTLKEVNLNGESLTIPEAQDGKYVIEKEVEKNGNYNVFVKDSSDGYKIANVEVKNISEDINIGTVEELIAFRDRVNAGATYEGKTVTLTSNLDLSSVCGADKGNWVPIGNCATNRNLVFKGKFDGNNHIIDNIYINNTSTEYQGLFGLVEGNLDSYAEITRVIIGENSKVYGKGYTGCIIGSAKYTSISYCENNGEVKGYTTYCQGGICGTITMSEIYRCINNGNVYGYWQVGGINGGGNNYTLKECINTGNIGVTNVTSSCCAFGGIVGNTYIGVNVINCYNTGTITGNQMVGGIVGINEKGANIKYCYNKGKVSGTNHVGSVVGRNSNTNTPYGNIYNSYYLSGTGNGVGTTTGGTINTTAVSEANCIEKTNATTSLLYLLNNGNEEPEWTISNDEGSYPTLKWKIKN